MKGMTHHHDSPSAKLASLFGMQRRLARERREFIFRKAKEQQERSQHDKKRRLKEAMEGTPPNFPICPHNNILRI